MPSPQPPKWGQPASLLWLQPMELERDRLGGLGGWGGDWAGAAPTPFPITCPPGSSLSRGFALLSGGCSMSSHGYPSCPIALPRGSLPTWRPGGGLVPPPWTGAHRNPVPAPVSRTSGHCHWVSGGPPPPPAPVAGFSCWAREPRRPLCIGPVRFLSCCCCGADSNSMR